MNQPTNAIAKLITSIYWNGASNSIQALHILNYGVWKSITWNRTQKLYMPLLNFLVPCLFNERTITIDISYNRWLHIFDRCFIIPISLPLSLPISLSLNLSVYTFSGLFPFRSTISLVQLSHVYQMKWHLAIRMNLGKFEPIFFYRHSFVIHLFKCAYRNKTAILYLSYSLAVG